MEHHDDVWRQARQHAHRFLARFDDAFTRRERDDLVQESAVAAWQWGGTVREPRRIAAAVCTIARRKRCQALRATVRQQDWLSDAATRGADGTPMLRVGDRFVPRVLLLAVLARCVERLRPPDRRILMAWQEGFCCAEIAARLHLSEESVKVRMHRARRRLRIEIEAAVRTAEHLDGFPDDA